MAVHRRGGAGAVRGAVRLDRRRRTRQQQLKVGRQRFRLLVALLGILHQAAHAHRLVVGGDRVHDLAGRNGFGVVVLVDERVGGGAVERLAAGEQFVQDHAQRVEIAAAVDRAAAALFRAGVGRRADRAAGQGQGLFAKHLGHAEVGDLERAVGGDEQVLRLDVAMDDAVRGGGGEALRRLQQPAPGLDRGDRLVGGPPGAGQLVQVGALDELHGVEHGAVDHAGEIGLNHVRRLDQAGGVRLGVEALQQRLVLGHRRRQHLQRGAAVEADLPGTVDHAHATLAEDATDGEVTELLTRERSSPAGEVPVRRGRAGDRQAVAGAAPTG